MMIHRDLLPIIFAYTGLSRRGAISVISKNTSNQCHSHHYITSLGKFDVIKLFSFGYENNRIEIVANCLKHPYLKIWPFPNYSIEYALVNGFGEMAKLLLASPLADWTYDRMFLF